MYVWVEPMTSRYSSLLLCFMNMRGSGDLSEWSILCFSQFFFFCFSPMESLHFLSAIVYVVTLLRAAVVYHI